MTSYEKERNVSATATAPVLTTATTNGCEHPRSSTASDVREKKQKTQPLRENSAAAAAATDKERKEEEDDYTSSSGSSLLSSPSSSEDTGDACNDDDDDDDDKDQSRNEHENNKDGNHISTSKTSTLLKSRLATFLPQLERSNRELNLSSAGTSRTDNDPTTTTTIHRIDDFVPDHQQQQQQQQQYVEMDLHLGVLSPRLESDDNDDDVKFREDEDEDEEEGGDGDALPVLFAPTLNADMDIKTDSNLVRLTSRKKRKIEEI